MEKLVGLGYDIKYLNHASAILEMDFPEQLKELASVLSEFKIDASELIMGGGGEALVTKRLRTAFEQLNWTKHIFKIEITVDGNKLYSSSHEVDHFFSSDNGNLALEIEWNNKDPFFDRDLENFSRLHSQNAISVGIIITRGNSLQENIEKIIKKCAKEKDVRDLKDLETYFGYIPTKRQKEFFTSNDNNYSNFRKKWAQKFAADKFGTSTTHWSKLEDRIRRGVGNPCPLCLIGIPDTVVKHDES